MSRWCEVWRFELGVRGGGGFGSGERWWRRLELVARGGVGFSWLARCGGGLSWWREVVEAWAGGERRMELEQVARCWWSLELRVEVVTA